MNLSRRRFLAGLIAAPVIVKAANIMPVRVMPEESQLRALADYLEQNHVMPHNGYYTIFLHPKQVEAFNPPAGSYRIIKPFPTTWPGMQTHV